MPCGTTNLWRVARLAELEITEHKPIRLSFHPYLDQATTLWLQRSEGRSEGSAGANAAGHLAQAGRALPLLRPPMLPDQEIRLVELVSGPGAHRLQPGLYPPELSYDVVIEGKEGILPAWMYSPAGWGHGACPRAGGPLLGPAGGLQTCRQTVCQLTFQEMSGTSALNWNGRPVTPAVLV